ncbi:hypothetical protein GH714_006502 [Hevea brasiliensis]|uniref:Uncharacterized protein n=1 Tax=Hevea brasiliensis TaxID=3981 RepID=A0A6A6NG10_HEVBR|nr:hypothetical protein GH714_006502 [Hevea brasiliensis]
MSVLEKPSSSSSISSSPSVSVGEIDPLLKDLNEKKQSFRRNVVSLAAELKEVRSRLASQEHSFEAENKAKAMEEEIRSLQKRLEDRNGQLQASATTAEKYLKELDGLRSQLVATQATADASAASAQSAQLQCLSLLKELDVKNSSLKEHEDRMTRLGEQLDNLQKDLQARESSQKQLKDEVLRIEQDIMQAIAKTGAGKDCELRKLLDEVSPKNFEKINKLLIVKDEEIAKLKDEIRIMSAHWKLKTKELETQMGERRDKALKELREQLATKQQSVAVESKNVLKNDGNLAQYIKMTILAMKNVIRMMHPIDGCKVVDLDVEVLKPGGISDPKPVVVPEPGLLEFNTDGGVTVLQKAHIAM